jgi:hypothetical protein
MNWGIMHKDKPRRPAIRKVILKYFEVGVCRVTMLLALKVTVHYIEL